MSHQTPETAAAHLRAAFDNSLLTCGGSNEANIRLIQLLMEHAASKTTGSRPMNPTEMKWACYATAAMDEAKDHIAVVTMVVDRTGLIRPLVSTKNLPEALSMTLRASVTDFLANVCSFIFKRPFRCGCRTCETKEGKDLHKAIASHNWNVDIKAQA